MARVRRVRNSSRTVHGSQVGSSWSPRERLARYAMYASRHLLSAKALGGLQFTNWNDSFYVKRRFQGDMLGNAFQVAQSEHRCSAWPIATDVRISELYRQYRTRYQPSEPRATASATSVMPPPGVQVEALGPAELQPTPLNRTPATVPWTCPLYWRDAMVRASAWA